MIEYETKRKGFSTKKIIAILAIVAITTVGITYAAISISWTQTVTVPVSPVNLSVSDSAGTITSATDQSSSWVWSGISDATLAITITNNGNAVVTPTITTSGLTSGWTLTYPTLTSISPGNNEPITLTLTPPANSLAGGSSGDFTITVA